MGSPMKVVLIKPLGSKSTDAHEALQVSLSGTTHTLTVSLKRTIRVPDNGKLYDLPPGLGSFPIYNIQQYDHKLPSKMIDKGGREEREALWIEFQATRAFKVKVYVGGVNAITGKPEQSTSHASKAAAQDYVVPPKQRWLDGIATQSGKVMQFVAAPIGTGYSVEAQVTGEDRLAGIQFEVIPQKRHADVLSKKYSGQNAVNVFVQRYSGQTMVFHIPLCYEVHDLKLLIEDRYGDEAKRVRLFLEDDEPLISGGLESHGLKDSCKIYMFLEVSGGGDIRAPPQAEMNIGAGGSINQYIQPDTYTPDFWDTDKAVMFNIQLLDATVFKHTLGIDPPPTLVTASTYAEHGYPFYKLYEQPSDLHGNFNLKSIGELDRAKGSNLTTHNLEQNLGFASVAIGWDKLKGKQITDVKLDETAMRRREERPL